MKPATTGGSVSRSFGLLGQEKREQIMEGRTSEVQKTNRESRVDRVASENGEEAPEVTRLLHQLVTEVERLNRGGSERLFPSNPCSREELAAALPIGNRFIYLAVVTFLF